MKKILGVLAALGCVCSVAASAAEITQWSYAETLEWSGSTFSAGGGSHTTSPSLLSWGDSTTQSSLGISPTSASGSVTTNGPIVPTNTITHTNNPLDSTDATLLSATLLNTLTLTPTVPSGPALPTQSITFGIDFKETSNATPCGFPSVSVCDDIFVIALGSLNQSFSIDGITYFISIINLTNNLLPLPAATCAAAGAAAGCIGFTTQENAATATQFGFTITDAPVSVPEPGALALLAIGLLGLYFVRARKSPRN